jgi:hypothetical protein
MKLELPEIDKDVRLAQLAHLNNRVTVYVTRLWQMPFAFLAIVCITISQIEKMKEIFYINVVSAILVFSGISIMVMISHHLKRVDTLISNVHDIENTLLLPESMARQKIMPYYFIVAICCIAIVIVVWQKTTA